ncbi:hypothetical protein RN001_002320 [Aquatica leii]|uniref:Uncharacterized protein n=1 Tax=Aquatica leii TaxID=1421715 RepID=A0AAN7SLS3_9COLE|nr:hypothetical protein RN001_002320 [Aquatica leii]
MEKEDELLFNFFSCVSQLCFDKAKEHIEKERECNAGLQSIGWTVLLNTLPQIILAEKSYIEIGFLQNKHKSFLRKDNSLRSIYETLKSDLKRLEENTKHQPFDKHIVNYFQHISQFLAARINLIDFYEKMFVTGSTRCLRYTDLLEHIETIIEKHVLSFTDIGLTPIKAVFSLECEILQQLLKALCELQNLQFLASLALIHGAQTRLTAWENKIQNRETWKLGFLKNNPLPLLLQWLIRFKGAVLSKFSLYFHDRLAQQTSSNDMRQLCSKLQFDYYHRMLQFQRKYDSNTVLLISDEQTNCDSHDTFPVIVSCPTKRSPQYEIILKMISDISTELINNDKIIYKYSTQEQCTYVLYTIESNIYLVIVFESKKSEKDVFIANFILEFSTNLRCSKVFTNLKNPSK